MSDTCSYRHSLLVFVSNGSFHTEPPGVHTALHFLVFNQILKTARLAFFLESDLAYFQAFVLNYQMSKAVIKLVSKQSCKVMQSSVRSSYLFLPISTIFCILPSWPAKQQQATLLTTVFPLTTMRRDTTNRWRSLVAGSYQMPLHWGYRCSRVRGAVLTDYHDNLRSPCVSCANVRHLVDFLRLYT